MELKTQRQQSFSNKFLEVLGYGELLAIPTIKQRISHAQMRDTAANREYPDLLQTRQQPVALQQGE